MQAKHTIFLENERVPELTVFVGDVLYVYKMVQNLGLVDSHGGSCHHVS